MNGLVLNRPSVRYGGVSRGYIMDLLKAKEIVKALAEGIDPTTGEVLPDGGPCSNPQVIRALFTVLESLKAPKMTAEERRQKNIAKGRPRNAGLPWPDDLRAEIASRFNSGQTIYELSRYFERSKAAITAELERQKLIPFGDKKQYHRGGGGQPQEYGQG